MYELRSSSFLELGPIYRFRGPIGVTGRPQLTCGAAQFECRAQLLEHTPIMTLVSCGRQSRFRPGRDCPTIKPGPGDIRVLRAKLFFSYELSGFPLFGFSLRYRLRCPLGVARRLQGGRDAAQFECCFQQAEYGVVSRR